MSDGPNVHAKVGTLRPGDRIYWTARPGGVRVVAVESYDDGMVVVVYSTGRSSSARFGDEVLHTPEVLQSLHAMRPDERIAARRAGS